MKLWMLLGILALFVAGLVFLWLNIDLALRGNMINGMVAVFLGISLVYGMIVGLPAAVMLYWMDRR